MNNVSKEEARKLVGKSIYALRPDGSVVTGKLVRISRNKLTIAPLKKDKQKLVQTKAIIPLVLFDLLAIGTIGAFGGGFGGGYGGGYGGGNYCNNNYNPSGYGGYGNQGYNGYGNQGYNGYGNQGYNGF
ncbi:nitrate reductase NapE component [Paenibacillus castaneae]|uniref:hypothetical protein n=1 Tax=Paenibacillus castaneae TaxID=474957 RepID=UPI000C9A1F79|nr:hypothetical protein [Paenibacillus castaneae]NIK76247.1 nitrate reductase NapE component [Paenibacillus castaneae]